jgi:limonene-1,2-epoxide hydrolase
MCFKAERGQTIRLISANDPLRILQKSALVEDNPDMEPRDLVRNWVAAFNRADADEIASLYADDAINHQVVQEPVEGRAAIRKMFLREFENATMVCQIENIFQDGEWAILEWSDPLGLRGCGFFRIKGGRIIFQRGYFDRLSFERQQSLSL